MLVQQRTTPLRGFDESKAGMAGSEVGGVAAMAAVAAALAEPWQPFVYEEEEEEEEEAVTGDMWWQLLRRCMGVEVEMDGSRYCAIVVVWSCVLGEGSRALSLRAVVGDTVVRCSLAGVL